MKKLNLAVIAALAVLGPFEDRAPAAAPLAPSALSLQSVKTTAEFLTQMRKHMEIGASDEIANLVRRNQEIASWAVIELCQGYSAKPSERVENEINALRLGWNKSLKTEYVERMYEYFSLMDSSTRVDRARAVDNYQAHNRQRIKAEEAKDAAALAQLVPKFREDADALAQVGDQYFIGMAWLGYGRLHDEAVRGDDADFDTAAMAYAKVIESRDKIDLHDKVYEDCKARLGVLEAKGASAEPLKPGETKKAAVTPIGDPITVPLTFRMEDDMTNVTRPIWANDEAYTSWNSFYLSPSVTSAKIGNMPFASVTRSGPTSFQVTSGSWSGDFLMNGKFVPVQVELEGPDGQTYPWGFIGVTGTAQDMYQGVQVNLEPADTGMTVYIAPAGVIEGEVNGELVQVFDDSMSGTWGDAPSSWGYVGLVAGQYQWDMDSVVIGKGKKALPWSKYQSIGGKWYELSIAGQTLTAQEVELVTGEIKFSFKGTKPNFMVIRGEGPYADCYYDLTDSKTTEVPAGQYTLMMGGLSKGKRTGIQKVIVLPGKDMQAIRVVGGEETEVKMGGPFKFGFEAEDLGESVRIIGQSVHVVGVAGERYERPWNNRPFPEGSVRKEGSKRGGKPERMFSQVDEETLYKDWNNGFFPQDLEIEKPKGAEGVEVQLTEKKNDLFGKLESDWIKPKQ